MKFSTFYKISALVGMLSITNLVFAEEKQNTESHSAVMTAAKQESLTPQLVLQHLKEGNQRFVEDNMQNRDLLMQAQATATKQHPTAIILNCIDSRSPPEIIFDQGIGDVFVARVAGNVHSDDVLGSMEYATHFAGAKLIAVIGHTSCGAVHGACENVKLGHLTGLLQKIQPSVKQAAKELKTHDCSKAEYVDQIAKDNVLHVMQQIQTQSTVIAKLIKEGKIGLVGGIQDLATGQVTFFDKQSVMPK